MQRTRYPRWALLGALVALAVGAAACSSGPGKRDEQSTINRILATTTTTAAPTTTPPTSTTSAPSRHPSSSTSVTVPDVIGVKAGAARASMRAANLHMVAFNAPCSKGTVASQSVVESLALPGAPPNITVGTTPLSPGASLRAGTRVGIAWSGCFGGGTTVPEVVGSTFGVARYAIGQAGLHWTCQDNGAATTIPHAKTVLTQTPAAGTHATAGSSVTLGMVTCPVAGP